MLVLPDGVESELVEGAENEAIIRFYQQNDFLQHLLFKEFHNFSGNEQMAFGIRMIDQRHVTFNHCFRDASKQNEGETQ